MASKFITSEVERAPRINSVTRKPDYYTNLKKHHLEYPSIFQEEM